MRMTLKGTEKYVWDRLTGDTVNLQDAIGQQRFQYGDSKQSLLGLMRNRHGIGKKNMLSRRFHSGGFNMINRRRRAQPRQMGGPPRLSRRNTQPNRGTFGIGQGINR